jgi:hypothetical protein
VLQGWTQSRYRFCRVIIGQFHIQYDIPLAYQNGSTVCILPFSETNDQVRAITFCLVEHSLVSQFRIALKIISRRPNSCPQALENGLRSERVLKIVLAEMYIQGVSSCRVAIIMEKLIGTEVSSTQVSRAIAELDQRLQAWRERPLGHYKYIWLDARYEKVRMS